MTTMSMVMVVVMTSSPLLYDGEGYDDCNDDHPQCPDDGYDGVGDCDGVGDDDCGVVTVMRADIADEMYTCGQYVGDD